MSEGAKDTAFVDWLEGRIRPWAGSAMARLFSIARKNVAQEAEPKITDEIAAERRRQIEVRGCTPEHDDLHRDGSLYRAAACYTIYGSTGIIFGEGTAPPTWPVSWALEWWKPKGRRRDLIRAAALIVAEIERLDRAAKKEGG